jgi:hypothetical protein
MAQDWGTARRAQRQADRALWSQHRQQLYLPLLGAVRELEARLSELADVYGGRSPLPFTPTSLSRDFRELYLLSPEEIPDLLASDGDQPRRDDRAVQRLRKRMCYELNFATSSRTGPPGAWPAPGWSIATSAAARPAWPRPTRKAWTG